MFLFLNQEEYVYALQIIKYLLTSMKIDVNTQNGNGFIALDVLSHCPRDLRDMEIKKSLMKAIDARINKSPSILYEEDMVQVSSITQPLTSWKSDTKQPVKKPKNVDWLGRKRSVLMVVASLIATVAFQSTLSPPGGL